RRSPHSLALPDAPPISSVLDRIGLGPQRGDVRAHLLQARGRMPDPAVYLADHAQRVRRAVGAGGIARVALVGEVGVVLDRPGRRSEEHTSALQSREKLV